MPGIVQSQTYWVVSHCNARDSFYMFPHPITNFVRVNHNLRFFRDKLMNCSPVSI